ncbi:MAG: hypothetical protein KJ579_02910 [Verrucomicrobia bacterium]|nr:hypothetical protein [Verrucomicrobiota bacterium]
MNANRQIGAVLVAAACMSGGLGTAVPAEPGRVIFLDRGRDERIIDSPTAPEHVRGLTGVSHQMDLDSGKVVYGLRYCAAVNPRHSGGAVPGEGYLGMALPSQCNWYYGGFLDLQIDGRAVGTTRLHSLTGRADGPTGHVDFIFDTTQAVVRIRFMVKAGDDALYTQALLEPKAPIKSIRLVARCYPSAFSSDAERHVLTPVRALEKGRTVDLDLARENWLFYMDRLLDKGVHIAPHTGVGPCAFLWAGGQTARGSIGVGNYGIDTRLDLDPGRRDFRFVFFDYAGRSNAVAEADLKGRADALHRELAAFSFTDPRVAGWAPAERRAEVLALLAKAQDVGEIARRYEQWTEKLAAALARIRAADAGSILAEAEASAIVSEWEKGLPELKLRALLGVI